MNLHACGPVGPLGESQANIRPESNVGGAAVCQMGMKQQNISGIAFILRSHCESAESAHCEWMDVTRLSSKQATVDLVLRVLLNIEGLHSALTPYFGIS